ncbi:MAG: hypothetical protein IPK60_20615 [Sandaracinaceae bacterium]|nr:hypothetical protein [Sandaracinaceae bacterium]
MKKTIHDLCFRRSVCLYVGETIVFVSRLAYLGVDVVLVVLVACVRACARARHDATRSTRTFAALLEFSRAAASVCVLADEAAVLNSVLTDVGACAACGGARVGRAIERRVAGR